MIRLFLKIMHVQKIKILLITFMNIKGKQLINFDKIICMLLIKLILFIFIFISLENYW